MASLGALVIELAANTARLQGDLGKAVGMAERAAGQFKRVFGGLAAAGGGLGLAAIAGQAISLGDELQKGALRAGVSAGEFSKLAAAAKQADVDMGTLSRGLKEMQKIISEAASGSKSATDSLDAIGLSAQRLRQLSPTKQLEAIADGLNRITDPADRSRRGAEILGKAYLDLVPALEGGAAGLRALVTEQEKLGNTFSDQQIKRLADADDAIKKLKASWSGFATTLVSFVAPALTGILNQLSELSAAKGIDRIEDRLRTLRGARNSIPVFFNFGYVSGEGIVMGPEALDREIARLERVADLAAGRKSRGRGSGPATVAAQIKADANQASGALTEVITTAQRLFDRTKPFRMFEPGTIDAGMLEDTRLDQFGDSILESTQGIADNMSEIFKQPFEELSPYADEAARNMQTAFADFLFDPFEDGIKGMLRGFVDVLRRMVAEAAAAKIFGSKKSGGLGLGDLVTGAVGSLFGFAQGGSFNVGGSGGTDSQLVAFKATPGERVSVSTPAQQKSGRSIVVHQSVTVNAAQLTQDQAARMVADSQRMMWDELDRRYGLA
jgi:hypothetical protein